MIRGMHLRSHWQDVAFYVKPRSPASIFGVVVIALTGLSASSACAQSDAPMIVRRDGQEVLVVPAALTEAIEGALPGFSVPGTSDLEEEWAPDKRVSFPYITWGYLNGDSLTDVAVVLLGDDEWKFAILHGGAGGYEVVYVMEGDAESATRDIASPQQIVLRLVRKEESWAPEAGDIPQEFEHDFDAVEFAVKHRRRFFLEVNVSLIYWDGSEYRRYW